jgi:hypothetical protein
MTTKTTMWLSNAKRAWQDDTINKLNKTPL